MGRGRALIVATIAVFAAAAAVAWASPAAIVGQGSDTFNSASYAHSAGTVATLTVTGDMHNVTANATGPDGKALFRSKTISGGSTPVEGTQYLAAGNYPFVCTVHPTTMQATLTVAGTPIARPTVGLTILSKKLKRVAKSGKLKLTTALSGASSADLVAKLGAKTIGSANGVPSGPTQLKLSTAAKSSLAGKKKAKILVAAFVDFGSPASAAAKLK